jgi:hypothetical protein
MSKSEFHVVLYLLWTATTEKGKLRKLAEGGSCYKYIDIAFMVRLRMMKFCPCIPISHALKFAASQAIERRARLQ